MKKLVFLLTVLPVLFFISCTKDEEEKGSLSYLTIEDIDGIWNKSNNDLFFISLSKQGKYSFCFNEKLMGAGSFSLDKDQLILDNAYLNTKDVLSVNVIDDRLIIKGNIHLFKQERFENVNLTFNKSNEQTPDYIVGQQWSSTGLPNAVYGSTREFVDITSEHLLRYRRVKDNALLTLINEENMFYIYRNQLTYTQRIQSDGNIHIYRLRYGISKDLFSLSMNEVKIENLK